MAVATSKLLKMARSRDDQDLVLRVAAGLTLQAQKVKGLDLLEDTRSFTEWVLSNPMTVVPRALSFVVSDPLVADKITVQGGTLSSEAVTDEDILLVIDKNFDSISTSFRKYGV